MSPSPAVTADLAHDLRLATMRLARRLRQQRADHGLPLGQLSVLATLTGPARTLLREDRRRRDEWLAEHLLGLDREQRAALRAALPVLEVLADS